MSSVEPREAMPQPPGASRETLRQQRVSANDALIASFREVGELSFAPVEAVELRCECGTHECEALIHVTGSDYNWARGLTDDETRQSASKWFLMAQGHVERAREYIIGHLTPEGADWEMVNAPAWTEPVDVDTLAGALEDARAQQLLLREELNTTLTRITGSASAGAVLLGFLTAFRGEDMKSLATPWVVVGFLILAALFWASVFVPSSIRARRQKLFFTPLGDLTWDEVAEFARDQRERRPFGEPGHAAVSYESIERLKRAEQATSGIEPTRLLPYRDWLAFELHRLDTQRTESIDLLGRAGRAESNALSLLFVLLLFAIAAALLV